MVQGDGTTLTQENAGKDMPSMKLGKVKLKKNHLNLKERELSLSVSGSQSGVILLPKGHLEMTGDILAVTTGKVMLLTSSGRSHRCR